MTEEQLKSKMSREGEEARHRLEDSRRNRALFDASPIASMIFDEGFHVVDCNVAAFEHLGYGSREELLDSESGVVASFRPVPSSPTDTPGTFQDRLRRALEHGIDQFEMTMDAGDGRAIPYAASLRRIREEDGSYRIVLYDSDLTAIKETRRELFSHDMLIECVNQIASLLTNWSAGGLQLAMNMSLAMLGGAIDADRSILFSFRGGSDEMEQRYWWAREGAPVPRDVDLSIVRVPNWIDTLHTGAAVCATESSAPETEASFMRARGARSVLIIPILMGRSLWGALAFEHCRDERILSAAEQNILGNAGLLIAAAILRGEMTNDLMRAKHAAMQSADAKSRFLSNMSHEMRTPMNAIVGMTAIAKAAHGDVEKIDSCLEKIERASQRMMALINDILDISKLESQSFSLQMVHFSLREMMQGLIDMNIVRAGEKEQRIYTRIEHDLHDSFIGDAQRIGQIINNLISNAMKFSPERSTVRVEVSLAEEQRDATRIRFTIGDEGPGIPKEMRDKIFEAFEQAESGIVRRNDGAGLGLAIVNSIVKLLDGELGVESEEGRGSRFWFEILLPHGKPRALIDESGFDADSPRDAALSTAESYIEFDFTGKTLLVVDDVEINREIVESLMEVTGAKIMHAEDGQECVETFLSMPERIDLIFMDINMPNMDGLEATRAIRASGAPNCDTIPILALTANAFAADVEACLAAGMDGHIAKPIDPAMLMERTRELIGGLARRVAAEE